MYHNQSRKGETPG